MYKQITLLLSFLFISISFCDTIKYKERKSSGDFEVRVVTDVEFLGVSRKGLHYQKSTFFGNVLKTIPQDIDWKELSQYEEVDYTVASQELACSADGGCEIVDL